MVIILNEDGEWRHVWREELLDQLSDCDFHKKNSASWSLLGGYIDSYIMFVS
jgi:hypothetical protein